VISGFCREVDENSALLGYYAASNGNLLPTFGITSEDGTYILFRNGGKKLPLLAA
jgi:hypothetical protein